MKWINLSSDVHDILNMSLTYKSHNKNPGQASSDLLLTSHQTLIMIGIVTGLIILNIVIASLVFYR